MHPSTASIPIAVLLYNGPLLCGYNVPNKDLNVNVSYSRCFNAHILVELQPKSYYGHSVDDFESG